MMSRYSGTIRTASRRRGITLVEVLATLVLVAIVLPVAMRGVTMSMQAASRARHMAEAGRLAENKLNELLMMRDSSQIAGTGDFGPDWPEYRWQSDSFSHDFGTYEVTVSVTWIERGVTRSVELTTLIYPDALNL